MSETRDQFGRPLRDLRISVTDRCNFRCNYCMPKEVFGAAHHFLPHAEVLTFEEIARVARVCAGLGVEKVRLTGGEPLLRRELWKLVCMLSAIDRVREVTLTTNGSRLAEEARALREAGLSRLTVSLDALDDATFRAMNGVDFPVSRVLRGIDAALAAGFTPIKLNMVVQRGVNDGEIEAMARRFRGPEFILRFIEYMDVGNSNGWRMSEVVPAAEILERIEREAALEPLPRRHPGETALRFRVASGGEIGVIASVTQPFCRDCSRARLTADGRLFTCLFAETGHDLRGPLRAGASDEELAGQVGRIWGFRTDRYSELRSALKDRRSKVEMSVVGG
jgi:GTP 3',8-cyclase